MNKPRSYKKDLLRRLKDPEQAVAYLDVALNDSEQKVFLLALRDVVEVYLMRAAERL